MNYIAREREREREREERLKRRRLTGGKMNGLKTTTTFFAAQLQTTFHTPTHTHTHTRFTQSQDKHKNAHICTWKLTHTASYLHTQ